MLVEVPVLVFELVSEGVSLEVDVEVSPLVSEEVSVFVSDEVDESVGLSQEESRNTPKVRRMNALLKGLKVCMLLIIAKRFQKQNNIYIIVSTEIERVSKIVNK